MNTAFERECVIWCPKCREEKFEIRRIPTGSEGVFVHKSYPEGRNEKVCECGTLLERKR